MILNFDLTVINCLKLLTLILPSFLGLRYIYLLIKIGNVDIGSKGDKKKTVVNDLWSVSFLIAVIIIGLIALLFVINMLFVNPQNVSPDYVGQTQIQKQAPARQSQRQAPLKYWDD